MTAVITETMFLLDKMDNNEFGKNREKSNNFKDVKN